VTDRYNKSVNFRCRLSRRRKHRGNNVFNHHTQSGEINTFPSLGFRYNHTLRKIEGESRGALRKLAFEENKDDKVDNFGVCLARREIVPAETNNAFKREKMKRN